MRHIGTKRLEDLLQQTESEHLDFKGGYSDENVSLIIDILALANSKTKEQSRFLIFGIEDETWRIIGVKGGKHRKSQDDVLKLLKSIINKIPNFQLYTLFYKGYEIDVLHIEVVNENQPYFLTKEYNDQKKKILPGVIYHRVGANNSIVANDDDFDDIFRRRLGLDRNSLDRAKLYLKDKSGWIKNDEKNQMFFYHNQYPEFTIQFPDSDEPIPFDESWCYGWPDKRTERQIIFIKCHGTILGTYYAVWLDGWKYLVVVPERWYFEEQKENKVCFAYYFIKDSFKLLLNELIHKVLVEDGPSRGLTYRKYTFPVFKSERGAKLSFDRDFAASEKKRSYDVITVGNPTKPFFINRKKILKDCVI